MKKFIKPLTFLLAFCTFFAVAGCFSACGAIKHGVSSIEDLYAMQSNKSYSLKCDLDLEGRTWMPLAVKNFNGNGHTIKNCVISESSSAHGGFFSRADKLNDVTFEAINGNIALITNGAQWLNGGIAAGEINKEMKNVTVKNCDMSFSVTKTGSDKTIVNIGAITGEFGGRADICGCTLINSNFTVSGGKGLSVTVGGIVGFGAKEILNCSVVNSVISGISTVGGIVGRFNSSYSTVKNCVLENSELNSNGGWVGGIAGAVTSYNDATVSECLVYGGTITVNAVSSYKVGGIVGYYTEGVITDCLVSDTEIDCTISDYTSKDECFAGGICGISNSTVKKCIVYESRVSGTGYTNAQKMFAAGVVARVGGSVSNCAAYKITVYGGKKDIFAPSGDTVFNSFIEEGCAPNANALPELNESEWESVLTKLSLDGNVWALNGGKPSLKNINLTIGENEI